MKAPEARLLLIGSELTEGRLQDAHAAFLAAELTALGFYVTDVSIVPDDPIQLRQVMRYLLESPAEVIISVGGLGHTSDDLTKVLWCETLGDALHLDEGLLAHLETALQARGVSSLPYLEVYATVPQQARVIQNPVGLAPALYWLVREKHIWALPGVPAELHALWHEAVASSLREAFGLAAPLQITLRTTGITESRLSALIAPWERHRPAPLRLAYNPSWEGVGLHLSAPASFALEAFEEAVQALRQLISPYLYGEGPVTLAAAILALMETQGLSLATAESCTGGHLAAAFVNVPGASRVFRGSIVAYHNEIKQHLLGVPASILETEGAVSEPTARAMAAGACQAIGSHVAIATTGIAGPSGGTATKPTGLVYLAVQSPRETLVRRFQFSGGREVVINRTVGAALSLTWQTLKTA